MGCSDMDSPRLREWGSWTRVSIEPWYSKIYHSLTSPPRTRKRLPLRLTASVQSALPGPCPASTQAQIQDPLPQFLHRPTDSCYILRVVVIERDGAQSCQCSRCAVNQSLNLMAGEIMSVLRHRRNFNFVPFVAFPIRKAHGPPKSLQITFSSFVSIA